MQALLTFTNLGLALALAMMVLSVLRPKSRAGYLVGLYVVCYADIVLVLQAVGLVNSLTPQSVFALQLLLTAAAVVLWLRGGRPSVLAPFAGFHLNRFRRDRGSIIKYASLGFLTVAVGYVYLRQAEMILAIFPNNYDALTYHLSRVGYWLQYHSLYPWPTPNPRQITFPMNAELGVLWTVLWTRSDRLSGFVQWVSVPAIILGIYGVARLLGHSRWSSALTGLLWATLTQVVFQSATTQNDLVTASFWIAAVYFFIAGMRSEPGICYVLSGAAFGLAIGTKSTSLMVLPGFGLGVLFICFMNWRKHGFPTYFANWAVSCLLGLLLLGSYIYIQNLITRGHPWEPWVGTTGLEGVQPGSGGSAYVSRLRDNLGRYTYQFVDFSPLPGQLASAINPAKVAVFSRLFHWLGIRVENPETIATYHFDLDYINPLNEDASWFGPLAILLIPAAIVQVWHAVRQRDALRPGLLVSGLGFVVVQGALQAWTPYQGRYYVIPVSLLFPLVAGLIDKSPAWRAVLAFCLITLALATMFTVALGMPVLKEVGWRDAFSLSRKKIDWPSDFEYRMLVNNIPTDASIGLTGGGNFPDYPFFGENFTHYLTLAVTDDSYLPRHGDPQRYIADFWQSDFLFLRPELASSLLPTVPARFDLVSEDGTYSVWMRSDLRSSDDCDEDKWPFRDFFQVAVDSSVCPRFPFIPAMASGGGPLYIPDGRFVPVITSSDGGRLEFDLLAKYSTDARISIRVDPQGFAAPQTLRMTLLQSGSATQAYEALFDNKGVLRFTVPLTQGLHTAQVGLVQGSLEVRILGIQLSAR